MGELGLKLFNFPLLLVTLKGTLVEKQLCLVELVHKLHMIRLLSELAFKLDDLLILFIDLGTKSLHNFVV